ncbi:MAG: TIGR04282 family arsenosugar biosynthesis glycosyltransferase [Clostridioides sp.]|jgi:rSAM/selenodomain-associated transferase 1|nr:TIGR04282 family arsenosugar biosynthesis glycosyltransferase [Clostridioides sp.]
MNDKKAIIIFTRVPVAGYTKTRLMPFLSGDECERLHTAFIKDIAKICSTVNAEPIVCYKTEKNAKIDIKTLIKSKYYFLQEGESLGDKMRNAFEKVFSLGYEKIVLIGTDIPQITENIINNSFEKLENNDIVINPTVDGGYYLVGMRRFIPWIFEVEHYGISTVFEETVTKIREKNISICIGEKCMDIDTKEDFLKLHEEIKFIQDEKIKYTHQIVSEIMKDK